MCGRFELKRIEKIKEYLKTVDLKQEGEIFPGDKLYVLASNKNKEPSYFAMKWGYAYKNRLVFNARSEDIKNKLMFKQDYLKHRCIIGATSYYEWDKEKNKYKISSLQDSLYLAGVYRIFNNELEFAVLTRKASDSVSWIHERMPLILKEEMINKWINPDEDPDEIINMSIDDMKTVKVL